MTKTLHILLGAAGLFAFSGANAGNMYPWRNHAAPYPFLFGNDFDTHQQTRQRGDGSLWGFLYVRYIGVVTADGYPVAGHVNCNAMPGDCVVGWKMEGKPAHAMFSHHSMHDHPMFTMPRADIPQPGAYSHFHWTGTEMPHHQTQGFVLQLTAKEPLLLRPPRRRKRDGRRDLQRQWRRARRAGHRHRDPPEHHPGRSARNVNCQRIYRVAHAGAFNSRGL